ncbi:hypothetical protein PM082_018769 [Marasmius tenuissimus]|nr:hypothetical protein PM082_018769 [Marasmius tenuissimus]
MITLYDIGPTTLRANATFGYSPFVRIIVLILRYKKLEHKIVPLRWSEFGNVAKSLNAKPTAIGTRPDGTARYTVPFIHDSKHDRVVLDSLLIAEYLDAKYPDTPTVIPPGTKLLQASFQSDGVWTRFVPIQYNIVRTRYRQYVSDEFQKEREAVSGPVPFPSAEEQKAAWEKSKAAFNVELVKLFEKADVGDDTFIMGKEPTFGDFTIAALFGGLRLVCGKDSEEWKEAQTWMGGRVGKICEKLAKDLVEYD